MNPSEPITNIKNKLLQPQIAIAALLIAVVAYLEWAGRSWLAPDNSLLVWYGEANGPATSQHLLDPYSFTHFLHGFAFCWLIMLVGKRLSHLWQLTFAIALEAGWEMLENSEAIIRRYREATIALGYNGDSIINSLSDILVCSIGFIVAKKLGFKKSLLLFVLVELFLLIWIRDSLTINVIMLICPVEAIKVWQTAG